MDIKFELCIKIFLNKFLNILIFKFLIKMRIEVSLNLYEYFSMFVIYWYININR